MIIFLDESGNLTGKNSDYFIVGTFTVGEPRRIAKAFRKWQKSKFPKKLRVQSEVKFNNAHLDDDTRFKTLKFLLKQDIRIFYSFLNKKNIPREYRKKGKVHETGSLYAEVVGSTLELYLPATEGEFRIIRDRKTLKAMTVSEFDEYLKTRMLPQLPAKINFRVQAVDSTTNPAVQVADWVCGALARYYEKKVLGKEFYETLKKNIVGEKELFSEYWTKRWEE